VKASPAEANPRVLLIEHHLRHDQKQAALTAAGDAAAALPNEPSVLDALGRAQLAGGQPQQALASFGKVAAAQPDAPQPQMRLVETYVQLNDKPSAKATLQRLLKTTPDYLPAQQRLIQIETQDKQFDAALKLAREIRRQRPTDATGPLLEGEILGELKQWGPAVEATRAALQASRTTPVAIRLHTQLALAGRLPEAERFASGWEREHPRDAEFLDHLGSMAAQQGQFAAAEARYRQVAQLRPDDALALNNVAWLLVRQNKPGALALAERAAKLSPQSPPVLDTLAATLAAEHQWPRALQTQRDAVAKAPDVPNYRLNLARLLIDSGDKTAARSELQKLAQLGDKYAGQAEVDRLLKSL
jgi:putative PEP-CTERM system TPR-repeat lipoprotein